MFGHIYNTHERRIADKRHAWTWIKRGQLISLVQDTEGSGVGRSNQGYSTPNYEWFSEIGVARMDFAGNYLDSFQIFPRRPEWLPFEPGSPLIQRLVTEPLLFDDEGRVPYWQAIAYTLDYYDQSAFAYHLFGDEKVPVHYRDYNPQFKVGADDAKQDGLGVYKAVSELAIPITMYDEEAGEYVQDARYHPDKQVVSRKISENPDSPYYEARGNYFYYDEDTNSIWKYAPAASRHIFFNAAYDWPRWRANFYRVGGPAAHTGFMHGRAVAMNMQRPKNTVEDVMHMAQMAALHGPKGENGFDFPRYIDPETGRVNHRLTLSEYIDFHAGQANPLRFVKPGSFMPDDGSKHDSIFDHGAVLDGVGTGALMNVISDRAPWVVSNYSMQRDRNSLHGFLTRQKSSSNLILPAHYKKAPKKAEKAPTQWNLFSLAERQAGGKPYDRFYYFLGDDSLAGSMKKLVFLRCDGGLHKLRFAEFDNKALHELSIDEMEQVLRDKNGPVRVEAENYFAGATHIDDVIGKSPRAQSLRDGQDEAIAADYNYITAHDDIHKIVMAALGRQARRFKLSSSPVAAKLLEDELNQIYAGEVPYIVGHTKLQAIVDNGPEQLPDIIRKVKKDQDDTLKKHMRDKDDALMQLMAQANLVDVFRDEDMDDPVHKEKDENGMPTPRARKAARALTGFQTLAENLYATRFKKKGWAYKAILDDITNPATGEKFFEKGKFIAQTVRQAYEFRQALCLRLMRDTDAEIRKIDAEIADGYVTQGYDEKPVHTRTRHRLLFADPDNGQSGNLPQMIDEAGRVLDYDAVFAMDFSDVREKLDSGAWRYRFHRLSSEPSTLRVVQRFVNMGLEGQVPETLRELYARDYIYRMGGFPDETVTDSRIPTLYTMQHELNHNKDLQEQALEHEEGQRILGLVQKWVDAEIRKLKAMKREHQPMITAFEPGTEVPLDYIPHEIARDENVPFMQDPNFVVLDVPLAHLYSPIEQQDMALPYRGLVVRNLDAKTREKINKDKPVLLRTAEGQIFATGKADIRALENPEDAALSTIMQKARADYDDAGAPLGTKDKLYYLGVENVYPLAATRNIKWDMQTFDMPFNQYYGAFAPDFARMPHGKPLTAAFIPAAYCPQLILPGEARFREVEGKSFAKIDGETGRPTGHIVDTKLKDIWGVDKDTGAKEGIPLGRMIEMIKSGEISERLVKAAGFLGGDQIERHFLENLTSKKWRGRPMDEPVLIATWQEVNAAYKKSGQDERKNKMAFIQPDANKPPKAALMRFGRPVYPSEYRPLKKKLG